MFFPLVFLKGKYSLYMAIFNIWLSIFSIVAFSVSVSKTFALVTCPQQSHSYWINQNDKLHVKFLKIRILREIERNKFPISVQNDAY